MISKETIEDWRSRNEAGSTSWGPDGFQNEVKDDVLARAGRYRVVHPEARPARTRRRLKVKEVWVEGRRYVVCLNEDEARKDAADREAIVASLREKLAAATSRWSATRAIAAT